MRSPCLLTKNSARLFSASASQRRRIDFIQKGACHVIASNVFAMLACTFIARVRKSGLCQVVETENVVKVIAESADVAMELGTLMFAACFV